MQLEVTPDEAALIICALQMDIQRLCNDPRRGDALEALRKKIITEEVHLVEKIQALTR